MPDLNEQLTLVRRAPRGFVASGAARIPVSALFSYTIFTPTTRVVRSRSSILRLQFAPFEQGVTTISAKGIGFVNNLYTTNISGSIEGEFPSGTRIRFNQGNASFIVRLTEGWEPGTAQSTTFKPMAVQPTPGASTSVFTVTVATDVDYLPQDLEVTSTATVWGRLVNYNVNQEVDDLGNESAVSSAGYIMRFDRSIASDLSIINATLTDYLGRVWQVLGVELEPGARSQYMTLRVKR